MTGKPAARIGDKVAYGVIVTGSPTVHIGTQGGVACTACIDSSNNTPDPVNPQLGAKVLLGAEDLDFALPGAMSPVWQRQYNSYVNPKHGAACGLLGHGWHLLNEVTLDLRADTILLHDAAGRTITFEETLAPRQDQYSPSEDLWLLRGGKDDEGYLPNWSRHPRFAHVSEELAGDVNCIIATNGRAEVVWVFNPAPDKAPPPKKPAKDNPAPSGQLWRLIAQIDRYGRSQGYQYSTGGESQRRNQPETLGQALRDLLQDDTPPLPAGRLIAITDGVGRRYRLTHQRIHPGKDREGHWAADDGWRLAAVTLERDPYNKLPEPIILARYSYNNQGQLIQVHNRAGELTREFEWTRRRISGHRYLGGPWHRYQYSGVEPNVKVIAHTNEGGLGYKFGYQPEPPSLEGKPRFTVTVTDSLKRVNIYHYEGAAGLSRLIEHQRADGSTMRYAYDAYGRLMASTDPLERTSYTRYDGQGNVTGAQWPDRSSIRQNFDEAGYRIERQDPAGNITGYQYDEYKRLTQITLPDGNFARLHYPDPQEQPLICDNPIRVEDPRGGIKHATYNEAGQQTSYTDCSGKTTHWDYDRWGQLIQVTDAQGESTRFTYDNAGRLTTIRFPDGQTARFEHDRQGNVTRVVPDENNPASAQEIGYDLWGRIIRHTQGGLTVHQKWDVAGRRERIINENGAQSWFVRDEMDRVIQEVGFDGRLKRYAYNQAGELVISGDGTGDDKNDLVTQYVYDLLGRLIESRIPGHPPELPPGANPRYPPPNRLGTPLAQIHRYNWDKLGLLKAAEVYLLTASGEQLQSRVEMERDKLGRITGELQTLYRLATQPGQQPEIEKQFRTEHKLTPLGNRLSSLLPGIGELQWLQYGAGHVHGIMLNGQPLIDFQRDHLHRETKRTLLTTTKGQELEIIRERDRLGRLKEISTRNLPMHKLGAIPRPLIGQLEHRQYHYDALSQLIAVEMPHEVLNFGYDGAGRLRQQTSYDPRHYLQAPAGQAQPLTSKRWENDPAGNRLPSQLIGEALDRQYSAELIHVNWLNPRLTAREQPAGPSVRTQWPNNRIGYYEDHAFRPDRFGNRVQQLGLVEDEQGLCPGQDLCYDGAHQLVAVELQAIRGHDIYLRGESRYLYDALGRRLKKTVTTRDGKEDAWYFGWDGDRHVHTEHLNEDGDRDITHVVYEPGSFTPLLHLSTTAKGAQAPKHLFVQAHELAVPEKDRNDPSTVQALAMMERMMAGMPEAMRKMHEDNMRQLIENGLPPQMQALMGETGQHTNKLLGTIRQGLKEAQQPTAPVVVRLVECDLVGTPIALINQAGGIDWAARLDPWGNIQQEYNPYGIEQNIRLPGQYHDRETDLYHNYRRYYDPKIGAYINQDPIGMDAGINLYSYVNGDPLRYIDPEGLAAEHTKNQRPSNLPKHEAGEARKQRDAGSEKGDKRRPFKPRRTPKNQRGLTCLGQLRGFNLFLLLMSIPGNAEQRENSCNDVIYCSPDDPDFDPIRNEPLETE